MSARGRKSRLPLGSLFYREDRGYIWRFYDKEGKRKEQSTGERDRTKAIKIAEQWGIEELAHRKRLIHRAPQIECIPIREAVHRYFVASVNSWAAGYSCMVAGYFDRWIVPFFGADTPVNEITSESVQRFKNHLLGQGIQPVTINKVLCSIRRMLVFCAENGELKTVPVVKNIKRQAEQHGRVLSKYERLRLLVAACRVGPDALRFVGFALYSGLRKSEALTVEWEDVDWNFGLIRLKTQKNRSTMPAPLGRMREILERIPKEQRAGRIVCYEDYNTGERKPALRIEKTWNRIKRIAKIKGDLRYHDLRHTFVTECYNKLSPTTAPVMARHSSREATAMYIHLERQKNMEDALNLFK